MILAAFTFRKMNNLEIITLKKAGIIDFAKERNLLLKKSKAEWVLFVDSDEEIAPNLIKEIETVISNGTSSVNGYYVRRKIVFLGKEIGEDKVLRLGRRSFGKWERRVHETWEINGKTGTLRNYIIHHTASNLHDYIEKINFYSTIHASENLREGKHANILKIILFPKFKFIQNILSGRGFVFSMCQSFHSFLGWAKQWELQKK